MFFLLLNLLLIWKVHQNWQWQLRKNVELLLNHTWLFLLTTFVAAIASSLLA